MWQSMPIPLHITCSTCTAYSAWIVRLACFGCIATIACSACIVPEAELDYTFASDLNISVHVLAYLCRCSHKFASHRIASHRIFASHLRSVSSSYLLRISSHHIFGSHLRIISSHHISAWLCIPWYLCAYLRISCVHKHLM